MHFWFNRLTHFKYFIGLITAVLIAVTAALVLLLNFGYIVDGVQTHITPYTHWISLMPSNFKLAFFFSIPIICALSFAQILHEDLVSGYMMHTVKRIGLMTYAFKLQALAIMSGALTVGLPLLLNFWVLWTFFPSLVPSLMLNRNMPLISSETYLSTLYYSNPMLLMLFYTALAMLVGGFYSLLSLAISCYTDNKFMPFVAGFLATLLLNMLSSVTAEVWSPVLLIMEFSTGRILPFWSFFHLLLVGYVLASITTSLGVQKRAIK